MELEKLFQKRLKRKNFFTSLGAGIAGYVVMRSFPFRLFTNKGNENKTDSKIKLRINPLAISRNKTGGNNGRS